MLSIMLLVFVRTLVGFDKELLQPSTPCTEVDDRWLAIDKWGRLAKLIAKNGGPFTSIMKLWRHDTLKDGELMGTDCFGNKYFQNSYYIIARNRWVEFNPLFKFEYDASQITAEWYGWLHHKTDRLPSEDCAKYCLMSCCYVHNWLQPHEENLSGTDKAYYPYSTIRSYITVWDGKNICERPTDTTDPTVPTDSTEKC